VTVTHVPHPGRARTMVERNLMIYRHTWPVILAEIVEPMLYLLAFGLGIGCIVGAVPGLRDASITYPRFVAPALLATAAMNGAMNETTFTMYGKLTADKTYESILTTPMSVRAVALGEVGWALLRGALVSTAFLAVVSDFGVVRTPMGLLVVPGESEHRATRAAFLGTGGLHLVVAVAYLAALGLAALVLGVRRLEHTLRT